MVRVSIRLGVYPKRGQRGQTRPLFWERLGTKHLRAPLPKPPAASGCVAALSQTDPPTFFHRAAALHVRANLMTSARRVKGPHFGFSNTGLYLVTGWFMLDNLNG